MNRRPRPLLVVALTLLVTIVACAFYAWRSPISAVDDVSPARFDQRQVRQGARLAAVGNCQGCHTTLEGPSYAGGVPIPTPFGTIYGSNITPDPETGIGRWSLAAFRRALREGVSRDGEHLYPAFPYDHFTHLAEQDIESLYAYFMTRVPVHSVPPANQLVFPLQFRPLLAGWKMLFFRPGSAVDASSAEAADRGTYLMEALGHCSACHSPRNQLGAERRGSPEAWSGGVAEGWYAPSLDARSPSPVPWTVDALGEYLRTGIAPEHALSAGPMQAVTHELGWADPADVRAIATSVVAMMGQPNPQRQATAEASRRLAGTGLASAMADAPSTTGSAVPSSTAPTEATLSSGRSIYVGACADCHDTGRGQSSNSALQLALAVALHDPDPSSLVRIVRQGIYPPDGEARRFMPGFEGALGDEQLVDLLAFLRASGARKPPWPDLAKAVHESHGKAPPDARETPGR